jgi:PadR family transcriptional regulator PadR
LQIKHDMLYGYTDGILLCCLTKGDTYGYEINRYISQRTEGRFELKEATLYTALRRLEREEYITSYWGTDKSGGPKRRYYSITDSGKIRLKQRQKEWADIQELIGLLLKEQED